LALPSFSIFVAAAAPVNAPGDFLGYDDLVGLGVPPATARRLLAGSDLTGHGGRPLVDARRLDDLLAQVKGGRP
jgi:hypothetical protein